MRDHSWSVGTGAWGSCAVVKRLRSVKRFNWTGGNAMVPLLSLKMLRSGLLGYGEFLLRIQTFRQMSK